ncbi:nitrilase-related carbon-nitrogen hydrolase [Phaeobacter piscinae]|uniref:nitrilase-related carbon-nitrogen hydrolase n=1 Tax=Phaeobacter piscinae TaxID=1580596 RepID=UPI0009E25B2B|nr:nitrilase-related carbon-nitrogen hydrolase [Phaeobacter piscinae]
MPIETIGIVGSLAPVFLDRKATTKKNIKTIGRAADKGAHLVALGETLLPAYPLWLTRADAARFESGIQKDLHALYLAQSVSIPDGHLSPICRTADQRKIAVVPGIAERTADRGNYTHCCSCVFIDADGQIASVHHKLMPTYEERLRWGIGGSRGTPAPCYGESAGSGP